MKLSTLSLPMAAMLLTVGVSTLRAQTLGDLNQVFTGPRATNSAGQLVSYKVDTADVVSPSQLASGQFITLSTRIFVDPYAANWDANGSLIDFGFARYDGSSPTADEAIGYGATPKAAQSEGSALLHFQNNSAGFNAFWNTKFFGPGNSFDFGNGGSTQSKPDSAVRGSYADYIVKIFADNTFSDTVQYLDETTGVPIGAAETLFGTLSGPSTATYVPILEMSPGSDTGGNGIGNPNSPWTYTVTNTSLSIFTPTDVPEPGACALVGALSISGLGMLARLRRARRAA